MKRRLTRYETQTALKKIFGEPQWGSYGRVRRKSGLQRFSARVETPHGSVRLTGEADWHNADSPPECYRGWCAAAGTLAAIESALQEG